MTMLRFAVACAATMLLAAPALAQGGLMDLGKGAMMEQVQRRLGGEAPPAASGGLGSSLSTGEIGSGLKEALRLAADKVTGQLGRPDGFNADPKVHIPLPDKLETLRKGLALAGQSGLVDDLELRLNRAAEAATPQAKQIFFDAVSKMTLDDARAILNGPSDAATQYFKRTMTPDLKTAMRPVVDQTVSQSGAVQSYQGVVGAAKGLPMVGNIAQSGPGMLTDHVLERALGGIFSYLGQEEADIRANPAKRSTDLLKKVFGG
ncbi:hypothetical protein A6A04_02245 [Paramagnetospirillum marisnigri]|uniref:DUF4197 domain-containing protein n=1 Tax=Paramagnetospirillum marisnigri TaxID=1285242 RepID=A0A178MQ86_9PROT|nr:DUF4197 domain-containing protein [Paramagnetospirillum marisnigri]OAN50245.1 hypothetical protein A6A04_02245 [Paramagnetospirillum marisnigri]